MPKMINDVDIYKIGNLGICSRHKCFHLNPLGNVFSHDDYELMYAQGERHKLTYEIKTLVRKRP